MCNTFFNVSLKLKGKTIVLANNLKNIDEYFPIMLDCIKKNQTGEYDALTQNEKGTLVVEEFLNTGEFYRQVA